MRKIVSYTLALLPGAKSGGKQVVAVADEEGSISLMSGEKDDWHTGQFS